MLSCQKGISTFEFVFVLSLALVVGRVALGAIPIYMEHRTLSSIVQSLYTDEAPVTSKPRKKELLKTINSKLLEQDIEGYVKHDALDISYPDRQTMALKVNYERDFSFFSNIQLVLKFSDEYTFPRK